MKTQLWYYQNAAAEVGPVTEDELIFLARSGQIGRQTTVRAADSKSALSFAEAFPTVLNPPGAASRSAKSLSPSRPAAVSAPAVVSGPTPPSLPPPLRSSAADSRTRIIAGTALILCLLLAFFIWWFWPTSPSGMAEAGSSAGAASAGEQQAAATSTAGSTDTGDVSAAAAEESPAAVETTAAADAASANGPAADASAAAAAATDNAAADSPAMAADSASTAKAQPPGDFGPVVGEPAEGDQAAEAADGLLVGSRGDDRFAISAPGETTFFGLRGQGRRFSWVVDCSGSMQGPPLERARQELLNSLRKLPEGMEFQVIFFDDLPYSFPARGFAQMDAAALAEAEGFVNGIQGGGGTNVMQGMQQIFSQRSRPDTAFLLTDGEFDPTTPEFIQDRNRGGKVRINTVAFVNRDGESLLRQIADENRGDFRFVP
ncbi:MAG: VWA domain-containing protein [Planctomycetaceae bacterium]